MDGVANKQADVAWVSAPEAEKAARFASAEAMRWIEWGMRSYHDFALGLALLLVAAAVVRTAWVPRPIAYLMGLSGLTYLVQGWVVGSEGFSQTDVDRHRAGLGPEPGVDDLAGRRRLADAGCGAPSAGGCGRLTHHPSLSVDPLGSGNAKRLSFLDRASALSPSSLETVRRIAESVIIAVISSAALYLVGSVYVDAYYGRLAIEVTSLDLPPPYVALQSVHALWGLLDYPLMLLLVYVLYRTLACHRVDVWVQWVGRARERFPRLLPVVANLIVVTPLLLDAAASLRERELPHRSVLTEINSVLGYVGLVLLVYVLWLGWSQRRFLLSEIQARKLVPIALVFTAYLLSALVTTGVVAELAAVDLLTGNSPASLRVTFVTKPGVLPELAEQELLLVAARNGAYYVVVREPSPPSPWATSYAIPFTSVEAARVRPFTASTT